MDELFKRLIEMGILVNIPVDDHRNRWKIREDIWDAIIEDSEFRPWKNDGVGVLGELHPIETRRSQE